MFCWWLFILQNTYFIWICSPFHFRPLEWVSKDVHLKQRNRNWKKIGTKSSHINVKYVDVLQQSYASLNPEGPILSAGYASKRQSAHGNARPLVKVQLQQHMEQSHQCANVRRVTQCQWVLVLSTGMVRGTVWGGGGMGKYLGGVGMEKNREDPILVPSTLHTHSSPWTYSMLEKWLAQTEGDLYLPPTPKSLATHQWDNLLLSILSRHLLGAKALSLVPEGITAHSWCQLPGQHSSHWRCPSLGLST